MRTEPETREEYYSIYKGAYEKYGVTPQGVMWPKGKQKERIHTLLQAFKEYFDTSAQKDSGGVFQYINTVEFDTEEYCVADTEVAKKPRILDIGCAFGDANKFIGDYISSYHYTGIDMMDFYCEEAKRIYKDHEDKVFINDDFLQHQFEHEFDFALGCGVLGFKTKEDNYEFAYNMMKKALDLSKTGVAFDFNSSKVEYSSSPHIFHYEPAKIIEICYSLSRNIVLRNDYFPFEYCVYVYKDDSFKKEDTIFSRFKMMQSMEGIT